mmetsp:Transcript_57084/g.79168  ORF Transcript_57084/g.79168 Transcript_57084/m.79168 type:complete len:200 (+) Transcript_57084:96-695(+)
MADGSEGPDMSVKHPLQNTWVLYFDGGVYYNKMKKFETWHESLQKVATVSTVEDFWGVFNNIPPPAALPAGANYYFFKEQCYPEMENDANRGGGKWQVITGGKNGPREKLNDIFLNLVMMMVGEQFEGSDNEQVCGAVVQNRQKGDRVAIWTSDAGNGESVMRIGQKFKTATSWEKSIPFMAHMEGKGASAATPSKYTV